MSEVKSSVLAYLGSDDCDMVHIYISATLVTLLILYNARDAREFLRSWGKLRDGAAVSRGRFVLQCVVYTLLVLVLTLYYVAIAYFVALLFKTVVTCTFAFLSTHDHTSLARVESHAITRFFFAFLTVKEFWLMMLALLAFAAVASVAYVLPPDAGVDGDTGKRVFKPNVDVVVTLVLLGFVGCVPIVLSHA
jgi:flagellar biosynthesis protein FlhB